MNDKAHRAMMQAITRAQGRAQEALYLAERAEPGQAAHDALLNGACLQLELALRVYCADLPGSPLPGVWAVSRALFTPSRGVSTASEPAPEWLELCDLAADAGSWLSRLLTRVATLRASAPADTGKLRGALFVSDAEGEEPADALGRIPLGVVADPTLGDRDAVLDAIHAFAALLVRHRLVNEEY